jgi:glucose/arabinose dehydrogenase
MRPPRVLVPLLLTALVVASCSTSSAAAALVDIGAGLKGPAGLRATVYATGLEHASAFAVDDQGRLWVATADYTDSGADAVWVVPSAGTAPQKIITGLHTPLGLLWLDGRLYVASKERVDAYADFDGSAFASSTPIVRFEAGVGEVNGLALGPDGRVRLGISSPCDHCTPTTQYSASVVSFLPDGSDLRTDASAIRAPIGLGYFPGTSDLFVTMNQRDDLGEATPGDWLSVVRDGQDWSFPDCYGQGGAACADQPSPVAVVDPHAAVSGVAIVTGQLGSTVGTSAIVAEWATGAVLQVALTKTATGYAGTVRPFVTGLKHPVPVLLDPTGRVVVGDWNTGTVYRIFEG